VEIRTRIPGLSRGIGNIISFPETEIRMDHENGRFVVVGPRVAIAASARVRCSIVIEQSLAPAVSSNCYGRLASHRDATIAELLRHPVCDQLCQSVTINSQEYGNKGIPRGEYYSGTSNRRYTRNGGDDLS